MTNPNEAGRNPCLSATNVLLLCQILIYTFSIRSLQKESKMSCIFCDFSEIKDRTIATVDGFHVTISLGQITNGGYLLVIPIDHTACLGALTPAQANHLDQLKDQLILHLEDEYKQPVTFFEHGTVGQTIHHAHLHIFPAEVNLKTQIQLDFPSCKIEAVNSFAEFRKKYRAFRVPYLLWSTPSNEILVCWNLPAKPEYLRLLTAKFLGVADSGSWKDMNRELDQNLIDETKVKLDTIFIP